MFDPSPIALPTLALASEGHSPIAQSVHIAVALIAVASVIGIITKLVRIPYTVALVICGLGIAMLGLAPEGAHITQDLVLLLFLPPLLFQAGLHTDLEHLKKAWVPVLVLALPGVVVTSLAVAAAAKPLLAAQLGEAATWQVALLLGVVLAPTDPISVVATFRAAGVPEKLRTVVEGESLFNDGTAVALFTILKVAVFGAAAGLATGHEGGVGEESLSVVTMGLSFVKVAGLGSIIGLALGLIAFWVLAKLDDHTLETAITVALAWGAFIVAEEFHGSGVIAVVVAALIVGNYGKVFSMSDRTRTTLTGFWDSLDFVVNSVLFLLIGFELSDPAMGGWRRLVEPDVLLAGAALFGVLLAARAAVVYPVVLSLKRYWPRGWKHVMWFAGLRGSLSLALILGLPDGPVRDAFLPISFLIVLISLLGQSVAMPWLIRLTNATEEIAEA